MELRSHPPFTVRSRRDQIDAASPSPTTPVTWQTILWTCVPLLINLWAQPAGRVLSHPLRYSKLARCFPFVAFIDSVFILLEVVLRSLTTCTHPSVQAAYFLVARFDDDEIQIYRSSHFTTELNSLSKNRGMRWLLFVLGTALPAIKLLSLEGIPWSKAIGLCWLVPWILAEVVFLLMFALAGADDLEYVLNKNRWPSSTNLASGSSHPRLNVGEGSEQVVAGDQLKTYKNLIYWFMFPSAVAHTFLAFWMWQDLILYRLNLESSFRASIAEAAVIVWMLAVSVLKDSSPRGSNKSGTADIIVDCIIIILGIRCYWASREITVLILHVMLLLVTWRLVDITAKITKQLSEFFLIWVRKRFSRDEGEADGDIMTQFWIAWLLLLDFILCVLWYAYRYDSKGTVNPAWTSVFG